MMDHNFLVKSLPCPKCGEECKLSSRKGKLDTCSWCCCNISQHEYNKDFEGSIHKFFLTTPILPSKTYFNSYMHSCKDIPYFNATNFLECTTTILLLTGLILFTKFSKCMFTCSLYQSSFHLDGEIKTDESLFGCKCKFHHGSP